MHAAVLGLLCIPLCVDVFALMGRDGICFVPLYQAVLQSLYRWLFFLFSFFIFFLAGDSSRN